MVSLRLRQFTWALSATVDLVGVTDLYHGRRVAFIAQDLARRLAGPLPWTEDEILIAALLHDCGVSSTEVHEHLLAEMEWEKAEEHCRRGAELLAETRTLGPLAGALRLHHRPWDQVEDPSHPTPDQWLGNLLFLADRVDVLAATQPGDILFTYPALVERLSTLSPHLFNPQFVDALVQSSRVEAFCLVRQEAPLTNHFASWIAGETPTWLEKGEFRALFTLFAQCVYGKSEFTAKHSRAVSRLATEIGKASGLDDDAVFRLGLAGLVHDIGKLRVPDRILNLPERLGDQDFSVMKHHSFDALDILSHIDGCEVLAEWASLHHERMDGSGYPYQRIGTQTPLEARILAVADVFQAVIQDRPYRKGMEPGQVVSLLNREAEAGRLDPVVVETVVLGLDHYWSLGQ